MQTNLRDSIETYMLWSNRQKDWKVKKCWPSQLICKPLYISKIAPKKKFESAPKAAVPNSGVDSSVAKSEVKCSTLSFRNFLTPTPTS